MSAPRLLRDEDVCAAVAPVLRKTGLDAVSTPEIGRRGVGGGGRMLKSMIFLKKRDIEA